MTRSFTALAGLLAMSILNPNTANAAPYCREFTKDIIVGGRVQQGYGTACQQPDGSWQVVNEVRPDPIANSAPIVTPRYDTDRVIYTQPAPVIYETYSYPRTYYRYPPSSSFSISIGNDYRNGWKRHHRHGRGYGWGHYKHHGHHGHHRH